MEIQTDNPNEGYPFPCFSYDERNSVALNTAYIMSSSSFDVRYILGILNSSVGRMIARLYVTQLQERQYRMLAQYMTKFPIAPCQETLQNKIIALVNQTLSSTNDKIEEQIDDMVYEIYCLSDEEVTYMTRL